MVLKSIMNERNELHVRLAFSCTGSLRSPFWDYKGRVRKLILPELSRFGSSATSLKWTALRLSMSYRLREHCSEILFVNEMRRLYTRLLFIIWEEEFLLIEREGEGTSMQPPRSSFKKTAALFYAKLKCFPRNFQTPAWRKERFSPCIFVASVAIRSAAKYSSEERFPLRGFQIRQLLDTLFSRGFPSRAARFPSTGHWSASGSFVE